MGYVSGVDDGAAGDNIRRIEGREYLTQHIRTIYAHAGHQRIPVLDRNDDAHLPPAQHVIAYRSQRFRSWSII